VAPVDEELQLVLTCGFKQCKWKIAHFPLVFTALYLTGRSGSSHGLSGDPLSLLNLLNNWETWYWVKISYLRVTFDLEMMLMMSISYLLI